MPTEVELAAERLRRVHGGENPHDVYGTDLKSLGWPVGQVDDNARLALAWLSEHPADECEPIDTEWLRSIGFSRQDTKQELPLVFKKGIEIRFYPGHTSTYIEEQKPNVWMLFVGDGCNRGQIRRLLTSQGISPPS